MEVRMSSNEGIDNLIIQYIEKEAEVKALGEDIRKSARDIVILFIDLSESTQIKQRVDPQEWLGYLYKFIIDMSNHAKTSNGTIIKRIGDELMLSFKSANDCEQFIGAILTDTDLLKRFRFKVGIDYGTVFYLQFENKATDDPYGIIVDRCARITKMAETNTILCSSAYNSITENKSLYLSLGLFKLKGFNDPQEIFIRKEQKIVDREKYLKVITDKLNSKELENHGYRFVSRKFSPDYFDYVGDSGVRPFLLRELLKVPKLSFTMPQFEQLLKSLTNEEEKYDYYGYLVEWEGIVAHYHTYYKKIVQIVVTDAEKKLHLIALLHVPDFMIEVVKMLRKGTPIRFRGIIQDISSLYITLDYVDFFVLNNSKES
jgi:class 3 adenylate cyclase